MLRIGGRSHATGAMPVVQRVVERVLSFHHLFTGKSKCKIRVVNELSDMHHQYKGLWRFLYNENFHCFIEGTLKALHVSRVKREPKHTLIELVEARKAIENWVGIEPCSRLPK